MSIAWIALTALIVLGLLAAVAQKMSGKDDPDAPAPVAASDCGSCDGSNSKCEQECMLEAAVKEIEYFDDEELDAYRGCPSDGYTDGEAEQFADILYSMRPEEVSAWNRSLILRGINVPDQIKDDFLLLLSESRQDPANNNP